MFNKNNLKIAMFCVAVSLLSACTSNSTTQATTEVTTEVTTEETSYVETVSSTTQETTTGATAAQSVTVEETASETTTVVLDEANTTDSIVESLIGSFDNKTNVACLEQNGAILTAYVDDAANSYVIYINESGEATLLYNSNGPMGAVVECYNSDTFVDYQQFDNTLYMLDDMSMGLGQLIKTWHLTPDGTLIDLADTIDFEVENPGLYVTGTMVDGVEKAVIGLREQIPGTEAIGSSQVVPVTLENEKIVKVLDVAPIIGG